MTRYVKKEAIVDVKVLFVKVHINSVGIYIINILQFFSG